MKYIKDLGFSRVAAIVPELSLGDPVANAEEIIKRYKEAVEQGATIIVTPELSLTGYTNGDLFNNNYLLEQILIAIKVLVKETNSPLNKNILIVGLPIKHKNKLFNCAAVISNGEIKGIVPKTYLPNYGEFYEMRHFASSKQNQDKEIQLLGKKIPFGTDLVFGDDFVKFGIEICEDAWVPNPPGDTLAQNGANIIINPSASNEVVGKAEYRKNLVNAASGRQIGAYVYVSSGANESSSDLVFGGHSLIAENGSVIAENKRFDLTSNIIYADINIRLLNNYRIRNTSFENLSTAREIFIEFGNTKLPLIRKYSQTPFVPKDNLKRKEILNEILEMQSTALARRLKSTKIQKCILGLSGGLDSTLALLVIEKAYKKLNIPIQNLIAVTMPGFGTTGRTYNNACSLAKSTGATLREIRITDSVNQHFKDIGQDPNKHDLTYENSQARERTQILFDISNMENGIVIGTGDLSELALGWCTYNGDHMSNYAVNCSVPKTLIKYLVETVAEEQNNKILYNILNTPVSPELLPANSNGTIAQITEDLVGPYELHDYFIYHRVRLGENIPTTFELACSSFEGKYNKETIYKWLSSFERRFATQQFKRNAIPDGPKVGTVSFSPRGDLRMPTDISITGINRVLEQIQQKIKKESITRIGIFGGSFNPIHNAHIETAENSLQQANLDKVIFVPARVSPYKQESGEYESEIHRLKMIEIAIKNNPKFEVNNCDIRREGVSYTIDMIEDIKKEYPKAELYFIGAEALYDIKNWHKGEELIKKIKLIVAPRHGYVLDKSYFPEGTIFLHEPATDISATAIRNGDNSFLPLEVLNYIIENNLYGRSKKI